jgi:hypothetical protein
MYEDLIGAQSALIHRVYNKRVPYIQKLYFKFLIFMSPKFRNQVNLEINRLKYWHNEFYYEERNKIQERPRRFDNTPLKVSKRDFWIEVKKKMGSPQLVVDLGSGVRPFSMLRPKYQIYVEKYEPYTHHLKVNQTNQNSIIINSGAYEFIKNQPSNSLDTIVLNDVIEHLEKNQGKELIRELQRVVKNKILIFTPNGFMKQHIGEDDDDGWGFYGNDLQNHLSGWKVDDFPGWELIVCEEYHLDQGYENGAIAAVYSKNIQRNNEKILCIYPNLIEKERISFLNECKNKLDKIKFIKDVSYLMHVNASPRGHTIYKDLEIPEGFVNFATEGNLLTQGKFVRQIFQTEFLSHKYERLIILEKDDLYSTYKDNLQYKKIHIIEGLGQLDDLILEIENS